MKIWVTRDEFNTSIWNHRPVFDDETACWNSYSKDLDWYGTSTQFKERNGFTPRKGSCKQYELTFKEIK